MFELPPALTVFGIITACILPGPAVMLLATPLTAIVLVMVRRLYLNEGAETVLESSQLPRPAVLASASRGRDGG